MLSPSDIRPSVKEVLLSVTNSISSYQILERLPALLRDRIILERGMPGEGSGSYYTSASLVTDAVEGLLPSLEPPYRVYLDVSEITFTVAGHVFRPGNRAIAFYRLSAPQADTAQSEQSTAGPPEDEQIYIQTHYVNLSTNDLARPQRWYDKPGWLWFWLFVFWPVSLYGLYKNDRVPTKSKHVVGGAVAIFYVVIFSICIHNDAQRNTLPPSSPDSTQTPIPLINPSDRVKHALEQSKQLSADLNFEGALTVLREVQSLSPKKISPHIESVKHSGAIALTKLAKDVRKNDPEMSLDIFNRAAALGSGEAKQLLAKVRRQVKTLAARDQEQKESASDSGQPVSNEVGVFITKDGYIASSSSEGLDRAVRYAVEKDTEALQQALDSGDVFDLKPGVRVRVVAHKGFLASVVKIRPVGETDEFWTVNEAIKRGW